MTTALILNRYKALETKGKGGFGTVDIAWDNRLQRRVAIKRIPLADNNSQLPGIQEARTAALLNETHIVSVLDFEVTNSEALLIMEFVDGPTLNDLLTDCQELLDLDTIAAIFTDIATALEYAHENQVLHLDIKPDNALIDHKGIVKVSDFGLSEISGSLGFSEPQGGTIGYMPPEQIEQVDIDDRTDLWALASILYLLLTGNNPFIASNSEQSLQTIINEPLVLPSELYEGLNPDADELIIKALRANKYERFASVHEFAGAISPYLGSVQKGRKNLKMMVNSRDLDEVEFGEEWHEQDPELLNEGLAVDDTEDPSPLSTWERLPQKLRGLTGRLIAVAACTIFAFLGLSGIDSLFMQIAPVNLLGFEVAPSLVIVILALVGICAFIVPQLGSALASLVLVGSLFLRGVWILGAVVAIILVLWWAVLGRKSAVLSTLVMLTPLSGFLCLSWSLPLLSGYFLSWRRALFTTAVQSLILISTAAITATPSLARTGLVIPEFSTSNINIQLLEFLAKPEPWICLLALLIACLIMTLSLERFSYLKAFLGLTGALCTILLCAILMPLALGLEILTPDMTNAVIGLVLSFILLSILLVLGVPADIEQTEEV